MRKKLGSRVTMMHWLSLWQFPAGWGLVVHYALHFTGMSFVYSCLYTVCTCGHVLYVKPVIRDLLGTLSGCGCAALNGVGRGG